MAELLTLQSLIERFPEHGDRTALLAFHKNGPEHWSYATLAEYIQSMAHG
jgi:hypothetical protein